ncbi:hypothetical protein [Streptomyces sp. NPDC059894]
MTIAIRNSWRVAQTRRSRTLSAAGALLLASVVVLNGRAGTVP